LEIERASLLDLQSIRTEEVENAFLHDSMNGLGGITFGLLSENASEAQEVTPRMKRRRSKESILSYLMVAGITDIPRPFSSIACPYQYEMTALWRVALPVQNPSLEEGTRGKRNLQVLDGLVLFEGEAAIEGSVTIVMSTHAIAACGQRSKGKTPVLVHLGEALSKHSMQSQAECRRQKNLARDWHR
jgi:hypothetical protein